MSEPTKDELKQLYDEAQARIAELEARAEEQDSQIKKLHAKGEGWLITAPEPTYDGVTYGVKFLHGMAFLRRDQEVPHFVHPTMKDTALQALAAGQHPIYEGSSDEMRKAIVARREEMIKGVRERENIPSAERAARAMAAEFGYKVEYYDAERLEQLQQIIDERAVRASEMAAAERAREQAGNVTRPGYMGE